jgi:16S rRNA (uracil1498-N3)-methyltransferase
MGDARGHAGHQTAHRFFVEPEAISADGIRLSAAQQHQIRRVLRLPAGARVVICDGAGAETIAQLIERAGVLSASPVTTQPGRREPSCKVRLCQSALRSDGFAWLLQKGTEIGVSAFVPVIFERTQPADYVRRVPRYEAIVREAAEQCERAVLPTVEPVQPLGTVLRGTHGDSDSQLFLLDERESGRSLRKSVVKGVRSVSMLIGPEGGLAEREREAAADAGFLPVSLGPRILRSETAGLVAATIVLTVCGEIG